MIRLGISILFVLSVWPIIALPQQLPKSLRSYLDRNYRGWELAGDCYPNESNEAQFLKSDFDGNRQMDYAVKFVRGKRGFFIAFLTKGRKWEPHFLHIWNDPREAKQSSLMLWNKGESSPEMGVPKLRFDSPADYRCESDVGGVHTFHKGRFIAY